MIATPPYSELNVDSCACRGTRGDFRDVPFLCDAVFHRFYIPGKLRSRILSRADLTVASVEGILACGG